jgi:HTH-type transcriptional regulator / antitoxin HigA
MVDVKPIKSNEDYERALEDIEALWGAAEGSPRGDKLDVLATLVEAYEAKHFAIDAPDPIEAIKFRMEQQGLTRKDLAGIIGNRGRIAEVLNGKRELSLAMIRRLNSELHLPAEVLIGSTKQLAK